MSWKMLKKAAVTCFGALNDHMIEEGRRNWYFSASVRHEEDVTMVAMATLLQYILRWDLGEGLLK